MISGYTGEGPKTIVPAEARVKITCRLVPDQDPAALTKALEQFLREQLPTGLTMEFINYHGCRGLVFDFNSPYMSAARSAIEQAFGAAPVMIRKGFDPRCRNVPDSRWCGHTVAGLGPEH